MSTLLIVAALAAAPVEFSSELGENGILIQGPRKAWMRRVIKRTRQANTVFLPRAQINAQHDVRNGVSYRTYTTRGGAYIEVSPGSAPLREHLRFRAGIVETTASEAESEQPSDSPPLEPIEAETMPVATPIDRLRGLHVPSNSAVIPSRSLDSASLGVLGLLVVLGLAGFALWRLRRRKFPELDGESIEIVTTRVLGPKHRLSIIDAGGERLLIATSDTEVRLLSSLGPTPRFDEPLPAVERAVDDSIGEDRDPSEDVAGLLRLRDESETRDESAARDFESVLRMVNSKQYVA